MNCRLVTLLICVHVCRCPASLRVHARQLRGTFIETSRHEPIKYRMMSSNVSGQGEAPFQYLVSTILTQLIYRMIVCHNLKALVCLCARYVYPWYP